MSGELSWEDEVALIIDRFAISDSPHIEDLDTFGDRLGRNFTWGFSGLDWSNTTSVKSLGQSNNSAGRENELVEHVDAISERVPSEFATLCLDMFVEHTRIIHRSDLVAAVKSVLEIPCGFWLCDPGDPVRWIVDVRMARSAWIYGPPEMIE